jgi:hypothetical protein
VSAAVQRRGRGAVSQATHRSFQHQLELPRRKTEFPRFVSHADLGQEQFIEFVQLEFAAIRFDHQACAPIDGDLQLRFAFGVTFQLGRVRGHRFIAREYRF